MKFQQRAWWCGPASIQNALRATGVKVGQARIARLCGIDGEADTDGEVEVKLLKGIKALGYDCEVIETDVWNEAQTAIDSHVGQRGNPVLVCIQDWSHWVCVTGGLGCQGRMRYVMLDPARLEFNKDENGVHVWGSKKLLKEWRAAHRTTRSDGVSLDAYYGIAITGRSK